MNTFGDTNESDTLGSLLAQPADILRWSARAKRGPNDAAVGKGGVKMARRGRTSIVREVKESLQAIDKIGESKYDARKIGKSGIHSKKQMANTMSDAQNFVKWCRSEHGVKSISDLTERHYASYLAHLREKGVSQGHKINVETSLRLLEKGFIERSKRFGDDPATFGRFCPEKRLETATRGSDVQNRSYTESEVQVIRENCSGEVQKAVDLMREMGLRVKEAVNVRVEHFIPNDTATGWKLSIKEGAAAGITKGGRFREIDVPRAFEQRLEKLIANKSPKECLVNVAESTVRDGVNVACKRGGVAQAGRGCHGFRHSYARERMDQLMTSGQKQMMKRVLENRKMGRAADYGILREQDKQLYAAAKKAMDQIHSELGHGKNRWALAMRYMGD